MVCEKYDDFLNLLLKFEPESHLKNVSDNLAPEPHLNSRKKFKSIRRIELEKSYLGSEFLDLLRGLTFIEPSKIAYFLDPESGKRIYVELRLYDEE